MIDSAFSTAVLEWFEQHGRKDLPWQKNINPYRVWVSEIMLQQTQVSTVMDYFQRFMQALPTVQQLASASEDEVLHLWTGLGYYTRARNLHKASKIIVQHYAGKFPRSVEELSALPGIGRSTAGAIASISMGIRAPILDGNVKRVLTRYKAIRGYPGTTQNTQKLWLLADKLTPDHQVNHYTQAMMDLGATLCTRSKPSCLLCPIQKGCQAHLLGTPTAFPEPKPRKTLPERERLMLLIADQNNQLLLYKRPSTGLWGGLWSFPEFEDKQQLHDFLQQHQLTIENQTQLNSISHTFSHFQLHLEPWLLRTSQQQHGIAEGNWVWYNLADAPKLGLAAPVKKLLKTATQRLNVGDI